jgi:uncharacterized protein (TIGR02246 family)
MTVDAAIETLLRAFEAGWASRDGASIARLFAPNAVFTAPTFERSAGRDAIARSEQQALDTYFRDTRVALTIERLTPVRDDVVIVHTTNRVTRGQATVVESHAMFVAEETAGQWSIAGWHNMVALRGAPPPP